MKTDKKTKFTPRRLARELVLHGLYSFEFSNNQTVTEVISDIKNLNFGNISQELDEELENLIERKDEVFQKKAMTYFEQLFIKVFNNKKELEEELKKRTKNWKMDRITLMDKLIIIIGLCELKYFDSVPPLAVMNEAIEISKKFSSPQSGKFINGILNAYYADSIKTTLDEIP